MRREATERFRAIRPASLGQAARIPGITPCDVSQLAVYLAAQARASHDPEIEQEVSRT